MYIDKNVDQRLSTDADQVEWSAFTLGSCNIDGGLDDDHIASAMDVFEGNETEEEWVQNDIANDTAAGGILSELSSRAGFLGDAYPFEISENSLNLKDPNHVTYIFCLAASIQKNITAGEFVKIPRVFELVAKEYTTHHFGFYAKSFHTGWPREAEDTPKNFKALVKLVNQESGEWWWGPDDGLEDSDCNHIKDAGVDFISWIESPDGKPGKLFITGQCACGNDWNTKFADARNENYEQWFNPVSWIKPTPAFCTPYSLVEQYLRDASKKAGLVYDRLRLVKLAANHENDLADELLSNMNECIKLVSDVS